MAMAEGRQRHDWSLQSALMAQIAFVVGDEDATPNQFNPFERADDVDIEPETISFSEARELLRNFG